MKHITFLAVTIPTDTELSKKNRIFARKIVVPIKLDREGNQEPKRFLCHLPFEKLDKDNLSIS